MQASATVPAPTTAVSPPHARVGRSSSIAPQPSATPASASPADFEASLAQAQAAPAAIATVSAGQGGGGKTLMPATQPEPVAATATPVPAANKVANTAPGTPVTDPEPDKQPAIAHETSEIALLPAALPPAQHAAPFVPATTASATTLPVGADTISLDATAAPATDATPPQPIVGQAAQATQVPETKMAALPGVAAAILHGGSDRPVAAAERAATTQAPDVALETIAAISAALPSPMPPMAAMATLAATHALPPPPPPLIRPAAAAEQPVLSPAAQVSPALASFVISAVQPNAPQHLIIRLDPAELGRVQVRIERTPDGPARVELVVERPDTLLMLLRDQPQLHRALDLAGVPAPDRTLQFQLAPAATPGTATSQFNAESGPGQHRPGQPKQHGPNNANTSFSDDPTTRPAAAFRRAGVNIMA